MLSLLFATFLAADANAQVVISSCSAGEAPVGAVGNSCNSISGLYSITSGQVSIDLSAGGAGSTVVTLHDDYPGAGTATYTFHGLLGDGSSFCCFMDDTASGLLDAFWVDGTDDSDVVYLSGGAATHLTTPGCDIRGYDNPSDDFDILEGSDECDDDIRGMAGPDVILGLDGVDTLRGGSGNDQIYGSDGYEAPDQGDFIYGGDGLDEIEGEGGGDTIYGGANGDTIYGGAGQDTIYGEGGPDHLEGGGGADTMHGGGGNDTLRGQAGNDTLFGGSGDDVVCGGNSAGAGADHLSGGVDGLAQVLNDNDTLYSLPGANLPTGNVYGAGPHHCGNVSHGGSWAGASCTYDLVALPTECSP
ncbi:MAG: hypothetical protein KTR31_23900 [Myxococcales bacterium]|nr:hypothetical protein [Myxococcales bacterium]